jgi:hypothetical protein
MFLKNIRLTNFRCYDSLVMDFGAGGAGNPVRKTTFVVGENGTGKSALLQAIALITGGSEALRAIPGIPDDYIRHRKNFCTIESTIVTSGGEERLLSLRLERGDSRAAAVTRNKASLAAIDADMRRTDRSFFTAGYGSGRRLDTDGRSASRGSRQTARYDAIRSLFIKETALGPMEGWAAEFLESSGNTSIHEWKSALNTFLPPEVRLKGADKSSGQLLFTTPDGALPPGALSSGHQQMVAWVGDLLCRIIRTSGNPKNPLAARGLLLVDEIDLHLHPAWQRQIHAFLARGLPNFQVIATTYSPLTVQQAGPGELYALRRNEHSRIDLVPFIGDPSQMLLHQMLMSPMFGLETDESVKVEIAKAWVRAEAVAGKATGARSTLTRSAIESLSTDLQLTVNTRSNSSAEPEDLSLLQQINASLQAGKKGKGI